MPRQYDIKDENIQRLVLRSLVASGYSQIRGIYATANRTMKAIDLSSNLLNINDTLAGCFLRNDINATRYCADNKGWQDSLSSDSLFRLYIFQSLVVNRMLNYDKKVTSDEVCNIANKISKMEDIAPQEIFFEKTKCSLPSKGSVKRDFIDDAENRKIVLTSMLSKQTEGMFGEQNTQTIKDFINVNFCFGKYSGAVAEMFFQQRMREMSSIEEEREESTVIGVTFDGEQIYQIGKHAETLTNGFYNGMIYQMNKEDPDRREPECTTEEFFNINSNNTPVEPEE